MNKRSTLITAVLALCLALLGMRLPQLHDGYCHHHKKPSPRNRAIISAVKTSPQQPAAGQGELAVPAVPLLSPAPLPPRPQRPTSVTDTHTAPAQRHPVPARGSPRHSAAA